jgi:site-specific recombinase XerD
MPLTVDEFLVRSEAGQSSIESYRKVFGQLEKMLGKPLGSATKADLGRLKEELRKRRSGPQYARRLRAFYKVAGMNEHADLMVLKQRLKKLDPDEILTLPDVNRLLAAADSLRDRALIGALWATGQRISAIASLTLGDLKDMPSDNGIAAIRLFFRKVKIAGEEHISYILDKDGGDHLRAWLRAYPFNRTADAPVFPAYAEHEDGKPRALTESGALRIVKHAASKAKLEKRVYPHLFRHSRATHLLRLGMSPVNVKKLLGWNVASPILEQRYAHLVDRDAYADLLRANGLPAPEAIDLGKLQAAEGDLRPVVAMVPPPGKRAPGFKPDGLPAQGIQSELDKLPPAKLREFARLLDVLAAAKGA